MDLEIAARQVWRFHRFMARQRDVLPAEERLLWEVADASHGLGHGQLCERLAIDTTNLGRLARQLSAKGLLRASRAGHDLRIRQYEATPAGRRAYAATERAGIESLKSQLAHTNPLHWPRLIDAMATIRSILEGKAPEPWSDVLVRPVRPGDLGWAIGRVGELQPEREEELARALVGARGWIAETGGQRSGCVFVGNGEVRLLFVDPDAYGVRIREQLLEQANACLRCTATAMAR